MTNYRLGSAESLQRITIPLVRLLFYHASLKIGGPEKKSRVAKNLLSLYRNPHNLLSSFPKGIASPPSPDLPFGLYVYLWDLTCIAVSSTLLALYQISVRGRERIATPLPSSQPRGFRLVVHYTWR